MNVLVIGGGASGMVAAIYAAKQGNKVTILEKNKVLGKKILVTGNGKCNYYNEDQNDIHYHSSNLDILKQIVTVDKKEEMLKFFNSIGIIPKIKNGYYYPNSNQATSIQTALIKEIDLRNINIIFEEEVIDISYQQKFIVTTNCKQYQADKVIIATGSKAAPKTGSDGKGYELAKKFGHTIIKPLPALVSLIGDENYLKDWAGIRSDVEVSLYENNQFIKKEIGEIQLTNTGISGICVFQLSGIVARGLEEGKKEQIKINFLPFIKEDFINWMNQRNEIVKNRTISELLDGLLNYKLVNLILKLSNIKREDYWNSLDQKKKLKLSRNLLEFSFDVTKTNSYDQAQVCSGGVSLLEVNPITLESKKQKGLYFTGELLDVNGDCGGYNLTFAFISGMMAGKNAGGLDD